MLHPDRRLILGVLATTLAYFITAGGALFVFGESTPIWFPNAIAVVPMLRHPVRYWPAYLVGAWVADAAAITTFGHGSSVLLTLPDMLEICGVAGMIRLTGSIRQPLFEGWQLLRVIVACLLGPVASATLGAAILSRELGLPFQSAWYTWYTASALGLLIVVPFLLSWLDGNLRARAFQRISARDALVLLGGSLACTLLLDVTQAQAAVFFTFPIVLGLTWAFGLLGASVGMLALAGASIWSVLNGHGALPNIVQHAADLATRVQALQVYLGAVLLTILPLTLLHAKQHEMATRVRRSGEARTEFLAAMSHEIRTPMTGVLGMADLLAVEELTPRQRSYVDAMRSSGRHLLSVINDVLDYSRIESGKLELEHIDFSLADALETLRSIVNPLAVERGLELRIDAQEPLPAALRGDPLRLRQVLLNLVSNAIKFTERGFIDLRVSEELHPESSQRWLRFEVQDSGVGIEPEKLQLLFTPFTQADRSISRQYGGSGLGLAISKRLVDAMGGSIGVSSVPGEGSLFSFEIPLVEGDAERIPQEPTASTAALSALRILIAEDVEINREILRSALTRQGHELVFATDGSEAVALVQRQEFDLVLMDVQMPTMDGVEATRRIRNLPAPVRDIPILGLTANVMARERERYLAAGMNDCLGKPIDWDALQVALARVAHGGDRRARDTRGWKPTAMLLHDGAIASLRKVAGETRFVSLMQTGMQGCEAACLAMGEENATPEAISRQAHQVKGSAGTLGLAAISALAVQIEAAVERGDPAQDLVLLLRATIDATRDELRRRGILPAA